MSMTLCCDSRPLYVVDECAVAVIQQRRRVGDTQPRAQSRGGGSGEGWLPQGQETGVVIDWPVGLSPLVRGA